MSKFLMVKKEKFEGFIFNLYRSGENFFVTREQIGKALGYKNPKEAISKIHNAHKERLDKVSRVSVLDTLDGKKREVILYSSKGIYEICRWSRQPKANEFFDFIYDILEELRLKRLKLKSEKLTPEYKAIRSESKEVTKDSMKLLNSSISNINSSDYIKANTIANKATGIKFGLKKMVKLEEMTSEMLEFRNEVLVKVASLMQAQALGVKIPHISEIIYKNI